MGIFYKSFNSTRSFGIEIELSDTITRDSIIDFIKKNSNRNAVIRQISNNNRSWHVKIDNTCGIISDNGWEIASYVGRNNKDLVHIASVIDDIKTIGAETNRECGFHIHVGVDDFSVDEMGLLLIYWAKIENVIRKALPKHRKNNNYCCHLSSIFRTIIGNNFRKKKCNPAAIYTDLVTFFEEEGEILDLRYYSVNIVNFHLATYEGCNRCTVELRFPESTLNARDIINWVRLFVSFVDNVKRRLVHCPIPNLSCLDLKESMSVLGLNHDNNFYIFSPSLNDVRKWFLDRVMAFSKLEEAKKTKRFIFPNLNN